MIERIRQIASESIETKRAFFDSHAETVARAARGARCKKSYTGQALRAALNGHRERKPA